jgi:hypothetical protein
METLYLKVVRNKNTPANATKASVSVLGVDVNNSSVYGNKQPSGMYVMTDPSNNRWGDGDIKSDTNPNGTSIPITEYPFIKGGKYKLILVRGTFWVDGTKESTGHLTKTPLGSRSLLFSSDNTNGIYPETNRAMGPTGLIPGGDPDPATGQYPYGTHMNSTNMFIFTRDISFNSKIPPITSDLLVIGQTYTINDAEPKVDWTSVGASNNNFGTEFTATDTAAKALTGNATSSEGRVTSATAWPENGQLAKGTGDNMYNALDGGGWWTDEMKEVFPTSTTEFERYGGGVDISYYKRPNTGYTYQMEPGGEERVSKTDVDNTNDEIMMLLGGPQKSAEKVDKGGGGYDWNATKWDEGINKLKIALPEVTLNIGLSSNSGADITNLWRAGIEGLDARNLSFSPGTFRNNNTWYNQFDNCTAEHHRNYPSSYIILKIKENYNGNLYYWGGDGWTQPGSYAYDYARPPLRGKLTLQEPPPIDISIQSVSKAISIIDDGNGIISKINKSIFLLNQIKKKITTQKINLGSMINYTLDETKNTNVLNYGLLQNEENLLIDAIGNIGTWTDGSGARRMYKGEDNIAIIDNPNQKDGSNNIITGGAKFTKKLIDNFLKDLEKNLNKIVGKANLDKKIQDKLDKIVGVDSSGNITINSTDNDTLNNLERGDVVFVDNIEGIIDTTNNSTYIVIKPIAEANKSISQSNIKGKITNNSTRTISFNKHATMDKYTNMNKIKQIK